MRDFTLETFTLLLQELKTQGYTFQNFRDFLKTPAPKAIVLRHDVDARKLNSLHTAKIEAELGIAGTYYFRIVPQSFNAEVIRQIAELGHEIGYHYEDLAMAARAIKGQVTPSFAEATAGKRDKGQEEQGQGTRDKGQGGRGVSNESWEELLYDAAKKSFESNLEKLRRVASIDTICMHGSPLSRYDNRKMWEHCDYRNYGITGEPYFDVDFSRVMYLTDTGRRWDGEKVSIRDKVGTSDKGQETRDKGQGTSGMGRENGVVKGQEVTVGDQGSKLKDQKEVGKSTIPLWLALPKLCRSAGRLSEGERGQGDPPSLKLRRVKGTPSFHSTYDIITAAKSGSLPAQIMITVHPQRWDNRMLPWVKELVMQNVKNLVKQLIAG